MPQLLAVLGLEDAAKKIDVHGGFLGQNNLDTRLKQPGTWVTEDSRHLLDEVDGGCGEVIDSISTVNELVKKPHHARHWCPFAPRLHCALQQLTQSMAEAPAQQVVQDVSLTLDDAHNAGSDETEKVFAAQDHCA